MNTIRAKQGFTLIEILVVIGIIAILATIVLIAINPARQFAQANNTQRTSDVNVILNAVGQYIADNKGVLPSAIPDTASAAEIKKTGGVDICSILIPTYVSALPVDPKIGAPVTDCSVSYTTGYKISKDTNSRVTVESMTPELGATIKITR